MFILGLRLRTEILPSERLFYYTLLQYMQPSEMVKTPKVTQANTVSKLVRATIPNNVVGHLKLKLGDVIEWETFTHNGKPAARIKKLS
jgi:hypothetical protein